MTYEARNGKTILKYGREANKFRYFHNFQTKAAPTFANGLKDLGSHIEFTVQISSKSTNSVIFSFFKLVQVIWTRKNFSKYLKLRT